MGGCPHWALPHYLHINFFKTHCQYGARSCIFLYEDLDVVLKTAAKTHNGFMNGTVDKGHGFLRKDIILRYLKVHYGKIVPHVTQFMWQVSDLFILKLVGDPLWFWERDEETRFEWIRHVQRTDSYCRQMHLKRYQDIKAAHWTQVCCILAYQHKLRLGKTNAKRLTKKHNALRYTNLCSLFLVVALQFTPLMEVKSHDFKCP